MSQMTLTFPAYVKICSQCKAILDHGYTKKTCERCRAENCDKGKHKVRMRRMANFALLATPTNASDSGATGVRAAHSLPKPNSKLSSLSTHTKLEASSADNRPLVFSPIVVPSQSRSQYPLQLSWAAAASSHPQSLYTPSTSQLHLTAIPHFNSRGELLEPPISNNIHVPPNLYVPQKLHPRHKIRLCTGYNCGHILPSSRQGELCARCLSGAQVSTKLELPHQQDTSAMTKQTLDPLALPLPSSTMDNRSLAEDIKSTASAIALQGVPNENQEDIDMGDLSLQYPEPTKIEPSETSMTQAQNQETAPTPARNRIPLPHRRHKKLNMTPSFLSTQSQSSAKPKNVDQRIRICSTEGCGGLINLDSTAVRCSRCILQDWKARAQGGANNTTNKAKRQKKTVTWADQISEGERKSLEDVTGATESKLTPDLVVKRTDKADDVVNEKSSMMVVVDTMAEIQPIRSVTSSEGKATSVSPQSSNGEVIEQSSTVLSMHSDLGQEGRVSDIRASAPADCTTHDNLDLSDHSEDTRLPTASNADAQIDPSANITGWDSDLTDISDSSSEDGESDSPEPSVIPSSTKLTIRIPARPLHAKLAHRVCTIRKCQRILPQGYRWKCCIACRAQSRLYQRKRQGLQGRHVALDIEEGYSQLSNDAEHPSLIPTSDKAHEGLVPGARLCIIRSCTHILPSQSEYRWKMCKPCQTRSRGRKMDGRTEVILAESNGVPQSERLDEGTREGILVSHDKSDDTVTNEQDASGRRCLNSDCGMLLQPTSLLPECVQCIARKKRVHDHQSQRDTMHTRQSKRPALYPEYRCLSALISNFGTRFSSFLKAQSYYFTFKPTRRDNSEGVASFSFEGEYSVVAINLDIMGRTEAVKESVLYVKEELEQAGGLKLQPTDFDPALPDGIASRFFCIYQATIFPQDTGSAKQEPGSATKIMQGELEIAVIADRSHHLFPGQRTIVRFRLVG